MRKAVLILLVLTFAVTPLAARDRRKKKGPVVDPELAKVTDPLIENLDDPSFAVREEATVALMKLGSTARVALEVAKGHPSPEVRLRVRRILLYYAELDRRAALKVPVGKDWPMLKRAPGRGAALGLGGIRERPEVDWVCTLPTRVGRPYFDAPLLAAGDKLVVVTRTGSVTAVSRDKGKILWFRDTKTPVYAGAVISGGRIFVPGKHLLCLDLATGAVLWRWKTDYGVVASPLVLGSYVYAVEKGEKLAALDPKTGQEQWSVKLRATKSAPVPVGDDLIIGTETHIRRIQAVDGKRVWSFKATSAIASSPAVLADRVIVGDIDRRILAVSLKRGRLIWQRRIPEGHLLETPVVYGDAILFSTAGATFRAIRAADGADLWTRWVGCIAQSSPCVAGGIAYFTAGANIHAMQCADGDDAWRITYIGSFSSPIYLDGRLHVLSMEGVLLALK